jgi:hypothetical protein
VEAKVGGVVRTVWPKSCTFCTKPANPNSIHGRSRNGGAEPQ